MIRTLRTVLSTVLIVILTLAFSHAYDRWVAPPPDHTTRACVACAPGFSATMQWTTKPDGHDGYVAFCAAHKGGDL